MLYNLHFFSSKCRLFHNAILFGFCITHILNTGCAIIWKKIRHQKVKIDLKKVAGRCGLNLFRLRYVSINLYIRSLLIVIQLSCSKKVWFGKSKPEKGGQSCPRKGELKCVKFQQAKYPEIKLHNINLLKPTGYVMHQQFKIQQLYVLPTLYLCVLYLSENKQQLVPLVW